MEVNQDYKDEKGLKLKAIFDKEIANNEELITNCERYAALTSPSEFLRDETTDYEPVEHDYQSIGGVAVNNLANKIMMTLFNPTQPFFRAEISKKESQEIKADTGMSDDAILKALSNMEKEAIKNLRKRASRTVLTDTVIQLIITGNACLRIPEDNTKNYQMLTLRNYIVKRDGFGEPYMIIATSCKKVEALPEKIKAQALDNNYKMTDKVTIYTGMERQGDNGKFRVWQELDNVCICAEKKGLVDKDELEFIPLVWKLSKDRDYGTGLVEMHRGTLEQVSTAAQALIDQMAVLTDMKYLVNPAGMTNIRELVQTRAGGFVKGREGDIFPLQANNINVIQGLLDNLDRLKRELGMIFLMNSAVTRDAERVTAQELRIQAAELESGLGGVYSRLAVDLQYPVAKREMRDLNKEFKSIEPAIIAGLDGLSRSADQQNINAMMMDLAGMANVPPEVLEYIDMQGLIRTLGANYGVEYETFLKSQEEVTAERQRVAQQQAAAAAQESAGQALGQQVVEQ